MNQLPMITWLQRLQDEPWRSDFYVAMRRIEGSHPQLPRLGTAKKTSDEPIRLGQDPALTFAPASLHSIKLDGVVPKISVRFAGLFGPMGALPRHLSEVAIERNRAGDTAFGEFVDLFHHRLLLFFYRAWRQSQPTASRDHPSDDPFAHYTASLVGIGQSSLQGRDSIQDDAKRFYSGHLSRVVRSEAGFVAATREYFSVPIQLESFYPRWVRLAVEERSHLGRTSGFSTLGHGLVIGERIFDAQSNIRLVVGPLDFARYESFLPGGISLRRLRDWVRNFFGLSLGVRVQLKLRREEVPLAVLGKGARLGLTCWIGPGAAQHDRDDLELGEAHV